VTSPVSLCVAEDVGGCYYDTSFSIEFVVMARRVFSLFLALSVGCASAYSNKASTAPPRRASASGATPKGPARPHRAGDADLISYRLPLRDNPVDPGGAFRCHGRCQAQRTPRAYLECLAQCPGFEVNEGVACAHGDVPPVARCITARKVRLSEQVDPRLMVAVIGEIAIVVALATLCTTGSCGGGFPPPR
jgi:hypothetical protein